VGLVQSVDAVSVWMVLGTCLPHVVVIGSIPMRPLSPSTMDTSVVWTQQYLVVSLWGGLSWSTSPYRVALWGSSGWVMYVGMLIHIQFHTMGLCPTLQGSSGWVTCVSSTHFQFHTMQPDLFSGLSGYCRPILLAYCCIVALDHTEWHYYMWIV